MRRSKFMLLLLFACFVLCGLLWFAWKDKIVACKDKVVADGVIKQLHPLQNLRYQGSGAGYQLADSAGRGGAEVYDDLTA